jgi:plasmid replication initiation protein
MSDLVIYKHNDLIDNFIFNATEYELQILNYAVATTNPTWDNKNLVYQISVPDLVALYKTNTKQSYKYYRDALDRLMKRTYSFYSDNKKHTENLVVRVSEDLDDKSFLEFKFNDFFSTRISTLKGLFTKYDIKHIAMFKSRYAFILYEFFVMKLNQLPPSAHKYSQKISVSDFKENLDLSDKYARFVDLDNKVLSIAKLNINKHSNIRISYEVIRKARTPTHIKFIAQFKKGQEPGSLEFQDELPIDEGMATTDSKSSLSADETRSLAKKRLADIKAGIF